MATKTINKITGKEYGKGEKI
jgi:hypothetical protein